MAKFTPSAFKEVKAAIAQDKTASNGAVAEEIGWSKETVRLVRKSRSYKAYRELASH